MEKTTHPALTSSDKFDKLVRTVELTPEIMSYMGVGRRYHNASFKRMSKGVHATSMRRFYKRMPTACNNGWGLIIYGLNSVGKTCAAVAFLKHARQLGYTGFFIEASVYIRSLLEKEMFDGTMSIRQRAETVDLLVFDDFGKESVNLATGVWGERAIEELFRIRNANMRSTILTTNWRPELWEEEMGSSFLNVLKESMAVVVLKGPNRRNFEAEQVGATL